MAYTGDQAQSLDPNQPADSTQESTMPDYVRTLTAAFLGWLDVCHYRTGKHMRWFGVDTGAVNAYAITIPHRITNLDAGINFTFIPLATNTGAATLQVTAAAGVNLGTVSIKKGGSNVAAGDIVAATPVQVIYDGTNFLLMGGTSNTTTITSAGGITLLANQEGGFTPWDSSTATHTLGSVNFNANSYSKIKIETEVLLRNNTGNAQNYNYTIRAGALFRGFETIRNGGTGSGVDSNSDLLSLSAILAGNQVATTTALLEVTLGANSANIASTLRCIRVYGID